MFLEQIKQNLPQFLFCSLCISLVCKRAPRLGHKRRSGLITKEEEAERNVPSCDRRSLKTDGPCRTRVRQPAMALVSAARKSKIIAKPQELVPAADVRAGTGGPANPSNESTDRLKRKKKKQRSLTIARPAATLTWTSYEYRLAALDANAPGFKPPDYKPPRVTNDGYLSSKYRTESTKPSAHPWQPLRGPYVSQEYQKDYPLPPISLPGCPLGFTPADGPWVQFFDSMWGTIWVSLKTVDTSEAAKEIEWKGFDWRKDQIA